MPTNKTSTAYIILHIDVGQWPPVIEGAGIYSEPTPTVVVDDIKNVTLTTVEGLSVTAALNSAINLACDPMGGIYWVEPLLRRWRSRP